VPEPPAHRTGYDVAVIGSGPAGLSAAQQLNRAGHGVTVFERDDRIGGLMMYGIPDFKFAKKQVERRVNQLRQEGIHFMTCAEVGKHLSFDRIRKDFDAVLLAIGAQKHRDLPLEGRDLDGVHYAMNYLIKENKRQNGKEVDDFISADNKNVIVLGGGDTGADCVATAHRQGAKQVIQISINPQLPDRRPSNNPWPEQPLVYTKTYAQEEGGTEEYSLNTNAFVDEDGDGKVDYLAGEKVEWVYDEQGSRKDKKVLKADLQLPADLVLIAIGFEGAQTGPFADTDLKIENGTFKTDKRMRTNLPNVFAAGDANMGQSLVVWAIGEGRDAAHHIDTYLQGESNLPRSVQTINGPDTASVDKRKARKS
jgi:glutamate synthase (NADPH/NADH) small chain